jgi:hypothetical protein
MKSVFQAAILCLLVAMPTFGATDFDNMTLREDCSNSGTLGSSWSQPLDSDHTAVWEGSGGICRSSANTSASMWWNASTFGPNAAAMLSMPDATTSTQGLIEIFFRLQSPGTSSDYDGYVCFLELVAEDIIFDRVDNSSYTGIGTCATLSDTIDNGDSFACEMIDSRLYAWIRRSGVWTLECTSDLDTTYQQAGFIGFRANKTDLSFDNFRFDVLPALSVDGLMSVVE